MKYFYSVNSFYNELLSWDFASCLIANSPKLLHLGEKAGSIAVLWNWTINAAIASQMFNSLTLVFWLRPALSQLHNVL